VERPPAGADALDAPVKATAIGLAWIGLFSLVYSVGDAIGAWPKWPLGRLRDLELAAGFLAAISVLLGLLVSNRAPRADR
jgi:hypothetical protein